MNHGRNAAIYAPACEGRARGDWVVLAAFDHNSKHTTPVQMTTVALGQFDSIHLRSLLVVTFNRRPSLARAGLNVSAQVESLIPRWHDAEKCESSTSQAIHHEATATAVIRRCALSRLVAQSERVTFGADETLRQVESAVNRSGGRSSGFHLRSDVFLVDSMNYAYQQYTRLDCLAVTDKGPCETATPLDTTHPTVAAAISSRVGWLQAFAAIAAEGFSRKLSVDDLAPGKADPSGFVRLPN